MRLGYTIVYVPDVAESLSFVERAFGLSRRFLREAGDCGEPDTDDTALAFAESLFRTAKFRPEFLRTGFASVPEARDWARAEGAAVWGEALEGVARP